MYGYLLRRVKRRLPFTLKNWSYQFLLFLAVRGLRLNVYRYRKSSRQVETLFRNMPALDAGKMSYMSDLFERIKQKEHLPFVEVTRANIIEYLPHLLKVERAAYPAGFQIDGDSLLARFRSGNHRPPICQLYFKKGQPVAYALGTYLEFYPPWEYGSELAAHPGFFNFSAFYLENICVLPSEQKGLLAIQSFLELMFVVQKRGYRSVVLHARTNNAACAIGLKFGFTQIKVIKGFLRSTEDTALLACFFPIPKTNQV